MPTQIFRTRDGLEIRCPTLIIAAGKEVFGDASAYERMRQRSPQSVLMQYDTAAHNICDGYADRCVDDLLQFLAVPRR